MRTLASTNAIYQLITEYIPQCRVILFGSRALDTAGPDSDYDILIVTAEAYPVIEERRLASLIRKRLALLRIDADVIVKSHSEAEYFRSKLGSIVREALLEGITLHG